MDHAVPYVDDRTGGLADGETGATVLRIDRFDHWDDRADTAVRGCVICGCIVDQAA